MKEVKLMACRPGHKEAGKKTAKKPAKKKKK